MSENVRPPRKRAKIIGIVSAILISTAILLSFTVPHVLIQIRTAQRNTCINHLVLIDGAKQQWALAFNKTNSDTPTWEDLRPYLGYTNGDRPKCPQGGTYTLRTVEEKPACTIPGHSLP